MEKRETLKEKTAKGLFWGGLSNGFQQLLNLVFGVFLARLLSTSDYGMVGMLAVFSAIASTLQEGGFISALNRKKDVTHQDYNSVFWTSCCISLFFYLLLFFSAPLIARFYNIAELVPLSRVMFLSFVIVSLSIAPRAYLFRNLMVRENTIISITCLLISGFVGVIMASSGFGYWSIVAQTIVYVSVVTILNFYYAKWRPTFSFDISPIKEIIGFSSKLIITNIFNIVNNNIFAIVLGRLYSPHEVGNYTQASKWNNMGCSFVNNMLSGIAQPVFSKTEQEKKRQKKVFRKLLRFTAFISFPTMLGLSLISQELIVILLTEKWIESAQILQILCVAGAFLPISNLFSNLLISRGHSSTYMWCSISLCIIQLVGVFLSSSWGIIMMIQVYTVINIIWLFIWYFYTSKEIDLCLLEVIKDISPYFVISCVLVIIAHMMVAHIENTFLSLCVKILFVGSAYCLTLWLLQSTIFKEVITYIIKRKVKQ